MFQVKNGISEVGEHLVLPYALQDISPSVIFMSNMDNQLFSWCSLLTSLLIVEEELKVGLVSKMFQI